MNFAELCVKHRVRVRIVRELTRVQYRVERRVWRLLWWPEGTYGTESQAVEAAKGVASALEDEGHIVWP